MLERFASQDGRVNLIAALRNQAALRGNDGLAKAVCERVEIIGVEPDETIIEESASTNDVYFILSGTVSIRVNDREIAIRTQGQHIGEMAVLDPGQPRSASAVAEGEVVVARVDAVTFIEIAESFPQLWRNIASELAERLRQRNRYVSPVNPRPVLFVGCSTEDTGRAIQTALDYAPIIVKVWTDGIFEAGRFPLESLELELTKVDFAALVLSPDDIVFSRDTTSDAPRDNMLFELGFFTGALGRRRTFLVCPREPVIKLPTDVLGLTPLTYRTDSEPSTSVAALCNELRRLMLRIGTR